MASESIFVKTNFSQFEDFEAYFHKNNTENISLLVQERNKKNMHHILS